MGIPNAKLIVDIVVLIAVTSCLNSALYTSSRMLFSLSNRGDAPAVAKRTNASGTPYWAVMMSTGAAFLAVFANYVAPAQVFEFLLASSGAIALLVYLVIAVSQLRMRQKAHRGGREDCVQDVAVPGPDLCGDRVYRGDLTVMLFQEAHRVEIIATGVLSIWWCWRACWWPVVDALKKWGHRYSTDARTAQPAEYHPDRHRH
jgi:GABA permease